MTTEAMRQAARAVLSAHNDHIGLDGPDESGPCWCPVCERARRYLRPTDSASGEPS